MYEYYRRLGVQQHLAAAGQGGMQAAMQNPQVMAQYYNYARMAQGLPVGQVPPAYWGRGMPVAAQQMPGMPGAHAQQQQQQQQQQMQMQPGAGTGAAKPPGQGGQQGG